MSDRLGRLSYACAGFVQPGGTRNGHSLTVVCYISGAHPMNTLATAAVTGSDHSSGAWVWYCAALWSFIFAIFHAVWAMGWYVALNPEWAPKAFADTSFLIYDIVVAGICLFAVAVALALVMPWGRRLPRWLVGFVAWTGTGMLVIRSVASVVQGVYLIATGQFPLEIMAIWEPWFYLGAILFSVSTWRFWRSRDS